MERKIIKENEEFVIKGRVFKWYFAEPNLKKGIIITSLAIKTNNNFKINEI